MESEPSTMAACRGRREAGGVQLTAEGCELIRLEPENEPFWREFYKSIMMQKEEILIFSRPTVKLSVTIPALYQQQMEQ